MAHAPKHLARHGAAADGAATAPREGAPGGKAAQATEASVGRSAALMSVLVIISRITGFFRTWTQAYALGAGLLASCYTVANNLPNQLYELVIGGMIATAFLPVYLSVKERSGREGANAYVSNLLSIVTILMGGLTVLCLVFAAPLIFIQSAGTDQSQMADAVYFFRFFAVEVLLYCLSSIASGVLNAERDYLWSNAAPIFNNFITIASFILYKVLEASNPGLALVVLALGNPLGVLVQVVLQMPSLRRHGVRISWRVDVHDPAIRETLSIGVPTLIVTGCSFVTVSVMNSFALMAAPEQGSSVQYYARLWYTLPYSVLSIPITVAMFTELSALWAKGDRDGYLRGLTKGASEILFTLMPFMLYLVVFAEPLMLLLRSGRFTAEDASLTAFYLRFLAIALPFYGLSTFFQKVFSSMRHMMLFAIANVIASAVQVVFTAATVPHLGIAGVPLGSVCYFVLVDGISFWLVCRELPQMRMGPVVRASLVGMALGAAGSLVGGSIMHVLGPLYLSGASLLRTLLCLVVGGVAAVGVTFGLALALKVPEAAFLRGAVRKLLHR